MNLTTIRDQVRGRLGLSANDQLALNADVTNLVNGALRDITALKDWPWNRQQDTITLVAGQYAYPQPTTLMSVTHMWLEDQDLHEVNPKDIASIRSQEGEPSFYTLEGGDVQFFPTPDQASNGKVVTMAAHHAETELVSDTDVPNLPDWAINALIALTGKRLAVRIKDQVMNRMMDSEYDLAIKSIEDQVRVGRGGTLPRRRGDWFIR